MEHEATLHYSEIDMGYFAKCRCGWVSSVKETKDSAYGLGLVHVNDTNKPATAPVIHLVPGATEADKETAQYFRELADRIEKGEIGNIIVAFNDLENYRYERFGNWKDRWTMYAALEYAKAAIDHAD